MAEEAREAEAQPSLAAGASRAPPRIRGPGAQEAVQEPARPGQCQSQARSVKAPPWARSRGPTPPLTSAPGEGTAFQMAAYIATHFLFPAHR